jgi:multiple sugar transport system substrate-binding protein
MRLALSAFALFLSASTAWSADITFQLWGSPKEGEVWTKIVKSFEAQHPDIHVKVELSDWDGYWEKLRVLMAGGTPPDVFAMSAPSYPDWQSRGVLLNLDPYLKSDPQSLEGIYPFTLEPYKTAEGYFGLPRDFQPIVLYYNKDMFDAAGVAYPTDKWTWNDLRETAKKLTLDKNGDGKIDQWGFWGDGYDQENLWGHVIRSYGGEFVDANATKTLINSKEAQTGFEFIRGMWLDDKTMPSRSQLAQFGYDGFLAGVAAMGLSGHWSVPEYAQQKFKWDVAPIPAGPVARVTTANSAGFVIAKASKEPDAAWAFVKYATGEAGQSELAKIGFAVPIRESVAKSDAFLGQEVKINHQIFVDATAYARPMPVFRGYEEWSAAVGDALTNLWTGDATLEDALSEAVTSADAALAKNK